MATFIAKCTPTLGRVSVWWARAAEGVMWPMGVGKALFYRQDREGNEVAEGRNAIVEEALEFDNSVNPISHLFWLDDDVIVFPGALLALLEVNKDIVSGTYFLKAEGPASQPLVWLDGAYTDEGHEGAMVPFVPDLVLPVKYTGMGLTLVRLDVYKRMLAELDLGKDKYGRPRWYHTATTEDVRQDGKGITEVGFTEDVYFYRQAAKLDIRPWAVTTKHAFGFHTSVLYQCKNCGFRSIDPSLAQRHKFSFREHRIVEDTAGYPEKQFRQWAAGESIVWDVGGEKVTWD